MEKRIKPHTDPTKAALMFTSPVPTPSITPPHAHTQKLSIVTVYLFFYSSRIFCLQNPSHLLFLSLFFHIPSFMCVCKPMLDLFSQCHCPVCLVNPLYHPFCWSSLVSVLLQLEHCTPAVWQEEETWMKKTAAALCAVSMEKLLTWQSLLPSQLGFDMLKYRERENGVIEKDSLQMALGIFGMNCQCF